MSGKGTTSKRAWGGEERGEGGQGGVPLEIELGEGGGGV